MKSYRKLVSLVLTVLMVLALLPASLAAEGTGVDIAALGDSALPEKYMASDNSAVGSGEPVTGRVDAIDLSEMHLFSGGTDPKQPLSFDYGLGSGGNSTMSAAFLTRWADPVLESDNPYPADTTTTANIKYNGAAKTALHVQEIIKIPKKACDQPLANGSIKAAIMTYGAAYASLFWDSRYENKTTGTYYLPKDNITNSYYGGGHAITIVGWDDNYAASNFKATPPGNGAYIIKNSWGTSVGNKGYYYVSYYDRFLASKLQVVNGQEVNYSNDQVKYRSDSVTIFTGLTEPDYYSKVFSYDDYGAIYTDSITGTGYTYYANKFAAGTTNQQICAVSFYTYNYNDEYSIYVRPSSGTSLTNPSLLTTANASGTIYYPGYHTIQFNKVPIAAGKSFEVIVAVRNTSINVVGVPLEAAVSGFNSKAKCDKLPLCWGSLARYY